MVRVLIDWAHEHGWKAFPEISTSDGCYIDLVLLDTKQQTYGVELKVGQALRAARQARCHHLNCDYAVIALPERSAARFHERNQEEAYKHLGILIVDKKRRDCRWLRMPAEPTRDRLPSNIREMFDVKPLLTCEGHKFEAAFASE